MVQHLQAMSITECCQAWWLLPLKSTLHGLGSRKTQQSRICCLQNVSQHSNAIKFAPLSAVGLSLQQGPRSSLLGGPALLFCPRFLTSWSPLLTFSLLFWLIFCRASLAQSGNASCCHRGRGRALPAVVQTRSLYARWVGIDNCPEVIDVLSGSLSRWTTWYRDFFWIV